MEKEEKETKHRYGIVHLERRRYPRIRVDLPVEYHRVESPISYTGRASNAGEGGLEVYFPEKMDLGQQLSIKLFFSSDSELNSMETLAELVWMDFILEEGETEYRCGVKFIDISPEELAKLKDFLKSLTR